MPNIHIIAVGKLKDEHWKNAEAEYLKRLKPFFNIAIHEIKEMPFDEKDPREMVIKKEAEKINEVIAKIKPEMIITLEEKGAEYSSPKFAEKIKNWTESGDNVAFIIGGPLGLDPEIVALGRQNLSLSPLTFTHQMARVLLVEQIYRAAMINSGRRYHY